MPRKRKLSDLSDRCRLCLTRDACMNEMFTDWVKPKLEDLEKCSSVKLTDKPNHPKYICYVCLYKLEMWNQFKTQFLKTNKTIVTHFKVIDSPVIEIDKPIRYDTAVDELFADETKKRQKMDGSVTSKPNQLETARKEVEKLVATDPVSLALAKFVEDINSDGLFINEEINDIPYVSKIEHQSTKRKLEQNITRKEQQIARKLEQQNARKLEQNARKLEQNARKLEQQNTMGKTAEQISAAKQLKQLKRKVGRPRKYEREASTKRWVERKNALIAATGSVPSESDSDTGPHLSPVQKARAKTNDKDFDKQKKIEKALKNLETNMTDKYKVNQDDIVNDERKTRSRKMPIEEQQVNEVKLDLDKTSQVEKTAENVKFEIEKPETEKEKVVQEEVETSSAVAIEEINNHEDAEDIQNDLDVINFEDELKNNDSLDVNEGNFKPQLVTSEVVVGNSTYVITTVLDLPESTAAKSDISLKTNGIHIDATNHDGSKIDLLNAVQLQRVNSKDDEEFINKNNTTNNTAVQKCLKIEIEGMEVEALQRVQLELAHFVNEDVHKRLFDEDDLDTRRSEFQAMKCKNSYETLEYQLKAIIEKVLRNNYDSEVLTPSMCSNHQKISHEFVKAAAQSPIFQPRVSLRRMNLGQLCKMYKVSNLHVLEAVKRKRGLVGPLSRTLGKRRHVLPKKYDGFALSMTGDINDEDKIKDHKDQKKANNKNSAAAKVQPSITTTTTTTTTSTTTTTTTTTTTSETSTTARSTTTPKVPQLFMDDTIMDDIPDIKEPSPPIVDIPISVVSELPVKSSVIGPKSKPVSNTALTPLPSLVNRSSAINCTPSTNKLTVTTKIAKPTIVSSTPKPLKRQRHICGICGKELFSKEEAEIHVKNHKLDSTSTVPNKETPSPVVKPKPKLMRCKRCQAIVEARHVKSHVCNSVKFNCNLCECTFGAEHLLQAHLETHAQFKVRQETTTKTPIAKVPPHKEKPRVVVVQENAEVQITQPTPEQELEITLTENEPQGYSCFVCDKIFVDEEQMKDHLQMHCEEVSDEGNEKGFQCAFCGEKFQSEESLEMHVGSHLHDDSDDKTNVLVNVDSRRDKPKKSVFRCERCSKSFASSLLLATHLPLHEEEDLILAEYEKQQEVEQEPHVCTICDEVFDTADELSDHLDVHNGNVHVCILCEKPFSSIRDLQEHVSTHL